VATTGRDYYDVLGVTRDSSEREIKSAFRRLARELHPDVSQAPDADERFREVAEAYEVLSKSETRELYDRYGHEGLRTGGFRPTDFDFSGLADLFGAFFGDDLLGGMTGGRRRSSRGADILAEVEVELVEAATGATRSVPYPVAVACATCAGTGAAPGTTPERCGRCGGAGRLQAVSSSVFGQFIRTQACPDCSGIGQVVTEPCPDCGGAGRVSEQRTLEVTIPAVIHDGQQIRLTGEGHAGDLGARAGDVYVRVHVRPDARFVRDGNDVISAVDLTLAQASLGATLTIPTLDGELELELPAGTQPGEVKVMRGKGMPVLQGHGRGDHRVLVNVGVPRRLTEEQRRLLEEFSKTEDEATYRPDDGLFDRLRSAFR
jgi:molecular chaperone DnaJ